MEAAKFNAAKATRPRSRMHFINQYVVIFTNRPSRLEGGTAFDNSNNSV